MKRYIALLLTTVYLLAVGGPSVVALTCRCITPVQFAQHVCCLHCDHEADDEQTVMHEPCCGNHHSTDIVLYTTTSQDSEKFVKRIVASDLPDALAAEPVMTAGTTTPVGCERVVVCGVGSVPDSFVAAYGLRAPPVLV